MFRGSAGVFFLEVVCRISMIWGGDVVMVLVVGSLTTSSFGWSFALGCRPAVVLRLLWCRFVLFCIVDLLSFGGSLLAFCLPCL